MPTRPRGYHPKLAKFPTKPKGVNLHTELKDMSAKQLTTAKKHFIKRTGVAEQRIEAYKNARNIARINKEHPDYVKYNDLVTVETKNRNFSADEAAKYNWAHTWRTYGAPTRQFLRDGGSKVKVERLKVNQLSRVQKRNLKLAKEHERLANVADEKAYRMVKKKGVNAVIEGGSDYGARTEYNRHINTMWTARGQVKKFSNRAAEAGHKVMWRTRGAPLRQTLREGGFEADRLKAISKKRK